MARRPRGLQALVVASGVTDWLIIVGVGVGGYFLGDMAPNKRHFQLENPDISFPYTVHETVSTRNLVIASVAVPVVVIALVSLLAVPGRGIPRGTPRALVWRRKLWELYASLLSFALGLAAQWFIINGLKNVCGKPRPDMLARCDPDLSRVAEFVVGGIANTTSNGQLVSAAICRNTDAAILDDGFRSYPSGHSGSAAAGLGHLALYLAYKCGVVYPFARPAPSVDAAFPSRARPAAPDVYELMDHAGPAPASSAPALSARQQGAAPPLFLLLLVMVPLGGSVFIAASRWYDYRHHGFDILFGYSIGMATMIVAFRLYHLPMSSGAGWAWGPRTSEKAFWAGVGSESWAVSQPQWSYRTANDEGGGLPTRAQTYQPDRAVPKAQPVRRFASADPDMV